MSSALSRRRFLRRGAEIGALAAAGLAGLRCGPDASGPALLRHYPDFLGGEPGLRALGDGYLEAHPAERDEGVLMEALFGDLPAPWEGTPMMELRRFLSEKVRDDFESGDVVRVRSWVLARSEARAMALYAL